MFRDFLYAVKPYLLVLSGLVVWLFVLLRKEGGFGIIISLGAAVLIGCGLYIHHMRSNSR